MLVIKQLMVPIGFYSVFPYYGKSMGTNNVWFVKILQNIVFFVQHKNDMRVSKWWYNFYFWEKSVKSYSFFDQINVVFVSI